MIFGLEVKGEEVNLAKIRAAKQVRVSQSVDESADPSKTNNLPLKPQKLTAVFRDYTLDGASSEAVLARLNAVLNGLE